MELQCWNPFTTIDSLKIPFCTIWTLHSPKQKFGVILQKHVFSALCLDHHGNEDVLPFPKEAEGLFICFVAFAGIRKKAFEAISPGSENFLKQ